MQSNALDMICWIMIAYDNNSSDSPRLVVHTKAKVLSQDKVKNTFFQDVMFSFDDLYVINDALSETASRHPSHKEKVEFLKKGIRGWALLNKNTISKNTTPNMFTVDSKE